MCVTPVSSSAGGRGRHLLEGKGPLVLCPHLPRLGEGHASQLWSSGLGQPVRLKLAREGTQVGLSKDPVRERSSMHRYPQTATQSYLFHQSKRVISVSKKPPDFMNLQVILVPEPMLNFSVVSMDGRRHIQKSDSAGVECSPRV